MALFRSVSATLRNLSCQSEQWGQWEESSLRPVPLSGWLLSDRADTFQIPSSYNPGFHLPLSYTHILIGLEPNVSVSVLGIPLPSSTHSFSVPRPFSSLRPRSAVSPLDNVQAILHRVHAPASSASCLVGAHVHQIQTRVLVSISFPAESFLLIDIRVLPMGNLGWGIGARFRGGAKTFRSYPSDSNTGLMLPQPNPFTPELGS
jgi:hypothetical protein